MVAKYPLLHSPRGGGGGHFDISSGNGWLYCALLFFLCKCPVSELISPVIPTQMYATGTRVWYHSRSKGGPLSPFSYLTRDICNHDQIPEQLKVPGKSQPAKPATKGAGNRAAQPTSSSNPQPIPKLPTEHVQEFKVVRSHEKKFHTVPMARARTQK